MKRLVPYDVLAGDVSLEVSAARLDDVALPFAMISGSQRVIALHQVERSDWETARLNEQCLKSVDLPGRGVPSR